MATEKRLIDGNGSYTINASDNTGHSLCYGGGIISVMDGYGHCICEFDAEDAPTVDAVEVVHGEWEITEDDYFDLVEMKCSVCGESYGFEDYEDCIPKNYHYCPNCGAKMDRERKTDG